MDSSSSHPFKKWKKGEGKVLNDPIHGHIELHPLLVRIIDTPQFQRLRHIRQLGGAYYVYPGASHNRFEHSIGVAHLAGELAESLRKKDPKLITDRDVLCVQIAGLCHDLGHGPFSHLFDGFFLREMAKQKEGEEAEKLRGWKHEKGSCDMFDHLVKINKLEPEMRKHGLDPEKDMVFIKEMIFGPLETDSDKAKEDGPAPWKYKGRDKDKSFLYEIVSNKNSGVDVDKFDYLARDSYHLGIQNNFDFRRFIKLARVCTFEEDGKEEKYICTRDKEVDNMYNLFHTRHCLHQRAYQHKVNKIIENKISEALVKAEPYFKIKGSQGREFTLSTAINDMEAYTKLTDYVFEDILNFSSNDLTEAKEILQNIISRKLPKLLGETRLKNSVEDQKKLISDLEKCQAQQLPQEILRDISRLKSNMERYQAQQLPQEMQGDIWRLKSDWERYLAQWLRPQDLKVLVVKMDYGMKDKDPVEHMYFYSKLEPDVAKKIPKDQGERIRTTCFSETLFRVYYNVKDYDDESYKIAKENLDEWWESFQQQQG